MPGCFLSFLSVHEHDTCPSMHVKMSTANYLTTNTVVQKSSFHYLRVSMCILCGVVHICVSFNICGWRAHTEPHGKSDRWTAISHLTQTVVSHANLHLFTVTQYFKNTDIKNLSHEGSFQSKKKEKEEHLIFCTFFMFPVMDHNLWTPALPRCFYVVLGIIKETFICHVFPY